jgi:hypothetical protein
MCVWIADHNLASRAFTPPIAADATSATIWPWKLSMDMSRTRARCGCRSGTTIPDSPANLLTVATTSGRDGPEVLHVAEQVIVDGFPHRDLQPGDLA